MLYVYTLKIKIVAYILESNKICFQIIIFLVH